MKILSLIFKYKRLVLSLLLGVLVIYLIWKNYAILAELMRLLIGKIAYWIYLPTHQTIRAFKGSDNNNDRPTNNNNDAPTNNNDAPTNNNNDDPTTDSAGSDNTENSYSHARNDTDTSTCNDPFGAGGAGEESATITHVYQGYTLTLSVSKADKDLYDRAMKDPNRIYDTVIWRDIVFMDLRGYTEAEKRRLLAISDMAREQFNLSNNPQQGNPATNPSDTSSDLQILLQILLQ